MTQNDPLITDEMVEKTAKALHQHGYERGWFAKEWDWLPNDSKNKYIEMASVIIETVAPDIRRPVFNILDGWKRDAHAYKKGLEFIRKHMENSVQGDRHLCTVWRIADNALKGGYHEPRE